MLKFVLFVGTFVWTPSACAMQLLRDGQHSSNAGQDRGMVTMIDALGKLEDSVAHMPQKSRQDLEEDGDGIPVTASNEVKKKIIEQLGGTIEITKSRSKPTKTRYIFGDTTYNTLDLALKAKNIGLEKVELMSTSRGKHELTGLTRTWGILGTYFYKECSSGNTGCDKNSVPTPQCSTHYNAVFRFHQSETKEDKITIEMKSGDKNPTASIKFKNENDRQKVPVSSTEYKYYHYDTTTNNYIYLGKVTCSFVDAGSFSIADA